MECEESVTTKQGVLATRARDGCSGNSSSRLNESRANCLTRLEVLSCSATVGVTLQLPLHASHVCHSGDLPIASQSRDLIVRLFLIAHS